MAVVFRNNQMQTAADTWKADVACYRESEAVPEGMQKHDRFTSKRGDEFNSFLARAKAQKESER